MVKELEQLIDMAKKRPVKTMSVAVADDNDILKAVAKAVNLGIINATLVGNKERIEAILKDENILIKGAKIINEKDSKNAAQIAVEEVSLGKSDFIMKGMINTADLLKAVLDKKADLRGKGILSHVMVYETPTYHKLIFLTDGGMIPYPDVNDKVAIINNAVFVASSLGIQTPKVAAICAVETVNPSMQSTIDASILSQMNKRGQIKNCLVDGPLGLDNSISKEAANHKGIKSEVAGDADILLVPNIESGNFLGKSLTYFGNAKSAGIIVGAKCPIVLVSRADSAMSKLYSIALGALMD
ncbi:bifunctional enoyl-CoA hydratase/phosphate acetyltransferase [Clostridium algidicarnis]|uniref:bifunctional enoyl-CoA hydratase/phosphate acetyltransferase n=1 Tax=Clostridium algidicarnis TaxID=37659 RepID=UPI001C0B4AAC|nr:bifunctional enoyl-CoA hydratase/phosphate acetyltransferase [Clostridium algidicarnis]MBU3195527.1 bifunctional enoyl-CoA hydratase/phosphate acetyltransferase [Clostridium algidicarnis]MBU3208486.1 bifunctional enoyl-CoA hydratase/phosphate acetyltransferase [Clostridium algidicarnis]MBU3226918.1 bifunctional enoyl-CoA hydratase/phosphate acetyltransferase [Clostridium algidicarnis]MBU3250171.1 bifunctional enoyl-CoA hydratase/phosphate acetyltransferase [Clostridium algidicarnis]